MENSGRAQREPGHRRWRGLSVEGSAGRLKSHRVRYRKQLQLAEQRGEAIGEARARLEVARSLLQTGMSRD